MNTNKDMEIIAPDGYEAYERTGKYCSERK